MIWSAPDIASDESVATADICRFCFNKVEQNYSCCGMFHSISLFHLLITNGGSHLNLSMNWLKSKLAQLSYAEIVWNKNYVSLKDDKNILWNVQCVKRRTISHIFHLQIMIRVREWYVLDLQKRCVAEIIVCKVWISFLMSLSFRFRSRCIVGRRAPTLRERVALYLLLSFLSCWTSATTYSILEPGVDKFNGVSPELLGVHSIFSSLWQFTKYFELRKS